MPLVFTKPGRPKVMPPREPAQAPPAPEPQAVHANMDHLRGRTNEIAMLDEASAGEEVVPEAATQEEEEDTGERLDRKEVLELLNVSSSTFYLMRRSGEFPQGKRRYGSKKATWSKDEVEAWVKTHR